jgi:hypothetical protein
MYAPNLGTRLRSALIAAYLPCMAGSSQIGAAEITRFEMQREDTGYGLVVEALLDAPMHRVWETITDYARLERLSPSIRASELLQGSAPGVTRLRTLSRLCILIFCKDLRHLQSIRELAYGDFEARTLPEQSDLAFGYARWRLSQTDGQTRINISFALRPAFWVPPFIGPLLINQALGAEALELVRGIERAASEIADGN